MKMISWNVNGLRACASKGFVESVTALDADVICLQETKMKEEQADIQLDGYTRFFNSAEKAGYSGTAIYTRVPGRFEKDMGIAEHDHEGRITRLILPDYQIVCCYTPNSQRGLTRIDYRMQWEKDFREYLCELDREKPVVLCGDLNVAHEEIDLKNPSTNHENAGFTDRERECMTSLLSSGFIDSFRYFHPQEKDRYSWWSYMMHSRDRNIGWRIDYFIVSEKLRDRMVSAEIHDSVMGSDHCPIELVID